MKMLEEPTARNHPLLHQEQLGDPLLTWYFPKTPVWSIAHLSAPPTGFSDDSSALRGFGHPWRKRIASGHSPMPRCPPPLPMEAGSGSQQLSPLSCPYNLMPFGCALGTRGSFFIQPPWSFPASAEGAEVAFYGGCLVT